MPWVRRLLLYILVVAGVALVVWFAISWFNPIVKVSDISRIRGN
jgi:hypothetical protein